MRKEKIRLCVSVQVIGHFNEHASAHASNMIVIFTGISRLKQSLMTPSYNIGRVE